jgi:hypothetical protein
MKGSPASIRRTVEGDELLRDPVRNKKVKICH